MAQQKTKRQNARLGVLSTTFVSHMIGWSCHSIGNDTDLAFHKLKQCGDRGGHRTS
jgi:hypothetical protein